MKKSIRIVYIDDNRDDAFFLEKTLNKLQCNVIMEHFTDLATGKKRLDDPQPMDWVFADLSLPDSGVKNTLTVLSSYTARFTIIGISGLVDPAIEVMAKDAGLSQVVDKVHLLDPEFFRILLEL